jgi:chemotaxis protein CheD
MRATLPAASELLPRVYLGPGMLHIAAEPMVLTTVLGSCVAVCLVDRRRRVAGMNHFVLPSNAGRPLEARYGDTAIAWLLDETVRLCGTAEDLEAKVFGGAEVLSPGLPRESVGARNVELALTRLAQLGIPVVAQRTGDAAGMVVHLHTATGMVLVKSIEHHGATAVDPVPLIFDI